MSAVKLQFRVRGLLAVTTLVALVTFGLVYNPLVALFVIAAACGHIGGTEIASRDGTGPAGAIFGGAIGGILWLFLQLVIGYTLLPYFEDSGVGFTGAMFQLCPFAAAVGAIIGCLAWLAGLAVRKWQGK